MPKIGYKQTKEHIAKRLKTKIGQKRTKEARKRMSESHKGPRPWRKGKHLSEQAKMKLRKAGIKNWQNPKYRKKQLEAIFSKRFSITKPERRLRKGLNVLFPNEYKFVGDGQVFVGGKSPDFINVNGQKKIIEMFGDFWHGEDYRMIAHGDDSPNEKHELQRIAHFAQYGFKTLVIWQHELGNIPKLKKKLLEFHKQKRKVAKNG